jgi:hypothetical protein
MQTYVVANAPESKFNDWLGLFAFNFFGFHFHLLSSFLFAFSRSIAALKK